MLLCDKEGYSRQHSTGGEEAHQYAIGLEEFRLGLETDRGSDAKRYQRGDNFQR